MLRFYLLQILSIYKSGNIIDSALLVLSAVIDVNYAFFKKFRNLFSFRWRERFLDSFRSSFLEFELKDQLAIDRGLDDALVKGWPLKRVEALMRAILRAAYYELKGRPDVPGRVVIAEYVDLAAAQALYEMEVADKGLADILAEFEAHWIGREVEGDQYNPAEVAFFRDVVAGVQKDQLAIDRRLDDALAKGWPLKRVEALMRAILRAAYYELKGRPDVPGRVVIAEYVDLANAFYGAEESGMINAVLDALARESRPDEFAARA